LRKHIQTEHPLTLSHILTSIQDSYSLTKVNSVIKTFINENCHNKLIGVPKAMGLDLKNITSKADNEDALTKAVQSLLHHHLSTYDDKVHVDMLTRMFLMTVSFLLMPQKTLQSTLQGQ
jgi:hypothetical protein